MEVRQHEVNLRVNLVAEISSLNLKNKGYVINIERKRVILEFAHERAVSEWQMKVSHKFKFDI